MSTWIAVSVMAGPVPAIHVFDFFSAFKTWMPATSAGMTVLTWTIVMAGPVPAIHVFDFFPAFKTWMPATSAGMTALKSSSPR